MTTQNLDSLFNVATQLRSSTVTHFSNQSMPDTGTLPTPDATIPGFVADLNSLSGVQFAGNSRSRLFVSSLRETLRSTTPFQLPGPNQPAYGGGLNPSYTFDAGMAVRSRPLPPPDVANQWQMLQVSNSIGTALQLSTDPLAGAGVVTWIWLTRTFRMNELFSQVRLEGPINEDNCGANGQFSSGCTWVFDRTTAMYDKISNRFLILLRSIDMAYPAVDPNNVGSNQARLYLAISTTSDVKGQYRLFRITPSSPGASPASCPAPLYPNIDSPVSGVRLLRGPAAGGSSVWDYNAVWHTPGLVFACLTASSSAQHTFCHGVKLPRLGLGGWRAEVCCPYPVSTG